MGAVEHHGRERAVVQVQPKHAVIRTRLSLRSVVRAEAGQMGHERERAAHVGAATVAETGVEPG